jgi:hypothetical protein
LRTSGPLRFAGTASPSCQDGADRAAAGVPDSQQAERQQRLQLFTKFIMLMIIGSRREKSREKSAKKSCGLPAVVATGGAGVAFAEKDLTVFPGPVVIVLGNSPLPAAGVRTGPGEIPGVVGSA